MKAAGDITTYKDDSNLGGHGDGIGSSRERVNWRLINELIEERKLRRGRGQLLYRECCFPSVPHSNRLQRAPLLLTDL